MQYRNANSLGSLSVSLVRIKFDLVFFFWIAYILLNYTNLIFSSLYRAINSCYDVSYDIPFSDTTTKKKIVTK